MTVTFLGTGTSTGVPVIGCNCATCMSTDPRDKRLRASVLLKDDNHCILIDSGPDFRQQALGAGIKHLDAILITHLHYDHIGGLDDVRPLGDTDVYADSISQEAIHRCLPYCFGPHPYPGSPRLTLHDIEDGKPIKIGTWDILPLRVMHGKLPILGFRIGDFAYLTDVKSIPESTMERLKGLDTLVINGLRHEPHPAHLSIEEAVELAKEIGAKHTYLTHFAHTAKPHATLENILPQNIRPAYDGLTLDIK